MKPEKVSDTAMTLTVFGMNRCCQEELRVSFCTSYALCLIFVLKVLFENVKYQLFLSSSVCCFLKHLENPAHSIKLLSKCFTSVSAKRV